MRATPEFSRLNDYVSWYARATPDTLAIAGAEHVSYAALERRVAACAAALAGCGVGPGDRVATLTTPGGAFLVSFLATALLGGIWVGLNPRHTAAELDAALSVLNPRAIFVRKAIEARNYESWAATLPDDVTVAMLADGTARALDPFGERKHVGTALLKAMAEGVDPRAACLIVFTSGSSGQPKGVMISQYALTGTSRVQLQHWPVNPLRVLNNLPINHIGCVGDLCCYALVGGGTNVFSERFDPAETMALCRLERVTMLGQVPTQFILTLGSPAFNRDALETVRLIIWGGAQASAELVAALRCIGPPVATSYGQTETVGSVTFTPPDASDEQLASTVGRCVPPYEIRIVDESGKTVKAPNVGEIQVRSPFRMNGYWGDRMATGRALTTDGWLRTGDVGSFTRHGMLRLAGRTGDAFKSGGYNIYPAEIERAIVSDPGVADVAVVSLPDPVFGMVGAAMIMPKAGAMLTVSGLRDHLRSRLANYKIPKQILIVDELPKLAVGKLDKAAIRERFLCAAQGTAGPA